MTERRGYDQVIRDLEPHLPAAPMTAKAIGKRVGMWAPRSIQGALDELFFQGKAARTSEPNGYGGERYLYWRSAAS